MKNSKQDDYYLNTEGNSFFQRNFKDKEVPELRLTKQIIYDEIKQSKIQFNKVLEYGGNYGDLLNYFSLCTKSHSFGGSIEMKNNKQYFTLVNL